MSHGDVSLGLEEWWWHVPTLLCRVPLAISVLAPSLCRVWPMPRSVNSPLPVNERDGNLFGKGLWVITVIEICRN